MTLLQRGNDLMNQLVSHYQFNPPLFDLLDHSALPDERLTAVQRAELALTQHLPGTAIVVADASATRGEHGLLDRVDVARRNEEGEFVHP